MGTFKRICGIQTLLIFFFCSSQATQFHVAPNATSGGNGSLSNPWQLQTALGQPSAVRAGDTIWVHGGTYTNPNDGQDKVAWNSTLSGTASQPIIVRSYPGEYPVLDGKNSQQNDILRISGNYVWYWGLEIYSSDPGRVDPTASGDAGSYADPNYIRRGQGINTNQDNTTTGNKFINCVVHDCFGGFAGWYRANTECYGCLFYNNGWMNTYYPRQHHGHNVYVQNATGEVRALYDCIMWGAFENNIQAWGTQYMDDFVFDGIVSFSYGSNVDGCNILLGNGTYNNPTVTNSMFYGRTGHPNVEIGYGSGSTAVGGNISNNYIGGGEVYFNGSFSGTNVSNNFAWYEYTSSSFPTGTGNTWTTSRPSSNKVFIRKSQYETGRANIVVYNWSGASSVTVDLSSVYNTGDNYTIVDVQNPTVPILSGQYSGPISLPMNLTAIAQPIGDASQGRTHTPAEFGTFIATGGSIPPPPPTNPPAVNTTGATNITPTGARLNGTVNPNGLSTTYHFDYGTTTAYGSSTSAANAGSGTYGVSANATVSGLTSGTLYHYRLVAANSAGTTNGNDISFTAGSSPPQPPVVSTSPASNVSSTGAQLNGSVNPNGASTTYHFDYGTTTSYGSSTSTANAGSGTNSVSVNATVSGLTTGTVYHYRLSGTNSGGTTNGKDLTFTPAAPPAQPPLVNTFSASNVTATAAQLNGSVNPNGASTTYHFDYGPTTSYGSSTSTASAGSGTNSVSVNATVSGLAPGILYHFRLSGTNSGGTTNGNDVTVTAGTQPTPLPTVTTSAATGFTATGAQLNGSVNPNGSNTTYHFEYGLTTGYGSSTSTASTGGGTNSVSVNATVGSLTPGTLYHFRLVGTNSGGTANGNDLTFTIGSSQKPPPTVSTSSATNISATGAQLNGSVNPNGASTTYYFEYGLTSSYSSSTPSATAGSGTSVQTVSAFLNSLKPGTIYLYRLVATSGTGTSYGPDTSFATQAPPNRPGVPEAHTLMPNYPNPFNPGTTIQYDLYQAGEVSLKIYSALGVEVATLVSGVQPAGRHSVQWEPATFVSGIYFCTLQSGGLVSTRRMILLK